jgi:hypothetical protein
VDTGVRPTMRVVNICGLMGQSGLELGPYVHLLDECALADPLLARLPAVFNDTWRVGHYRRMILCDERPGHQAMDISVDSDDSYAIFFLRQGQNVGRVEISPVPPYRRPAGLVRYPVDLPPGAIARGFDTIVVSAAAGDDPPALGHLLLDSR